MKLNKEKVYTLDELRNILIPVCKQLGLSKLGIFGSYARGTATGKSDIDILTLIDDYATYEAFDDTLKKVLCKKYDIVDYRYIVPAFKDEVLEDGVLIYEEQ